MRAVFIHVIIALLLFIGLMNGALAQSRDRFKIHSLTFSGNEAFSDHRLKDLMVTRSASFLRSSRFHRAVFRDDLANLLAFYHNEGYFDAAISDTSITVDDKSKGVYIRVSISEGQLYRIEGITVFANTVFSDSVLLSQVKLQPGEPCRRNRIQQGMLNMVNLYADSGYLEAAVRPEIRDNKETHGVLIDFTVSEGRQSSVGEIRIQRLEKTNHNVATRELLFKQGEVVNYSRLLKSERGLYLTNLFQSVFIRPGDFDDSAGSSRTILIDIKEKKSSEFNVAVGYGSVEKVFGRVELASTNLAGTARQAGVSIDGSFIKRAIGASFTEPWTFGTRLQTDIRSSYEFVEEPGYMFSRVGARLSVGRSFGRYTHATLSYRLENVKLRNVTIDDPPEDLDPRVRSLALSFSMDSRDNLFDPHRGTYVEWTNELAGAFLRGSNTFARSIADFKKFISLNRQTVIASGLEIGWMDYLGSSIDIPLNERFYAGGPNSIRGFDYQMVGPVDSDGDPLGGKFKLVWNAIEVRRAIYKVFALVAFADLGNVWSDVRAARLDDIRTAAGVGLRANTPIGIIRLDYGVNLDPRDDEAPQKFVFGMGHAF